MEIIIEIDDSKLEKLKKALTLIAEMDGISVEYNHDSASIPIERTNSNYNILDAAGIWKDDPVPFEEIRKSAWKNRK